MMKEVYEAPEMEVVHFETEDIITTSNEYFYDDNLYDLGDTGWDQ